MAPPRPEKSTAKAEASLAPTSIPAGSGSKKVKIQRMAVADSKVKSIRQNSTIHSKNTIRELLIKAEKVTTALPPQVERDRRKTLQRVQQLISTKYSPAYRVEIFGSTRYGVSTATSDLDMVILDPNNNGNYEDRTHHIYNIRRLAEHFRRAGYREVIGLSRAKVPIVKFRDPETKLQGDINIDDRLGIFNSDLIKTYCDILPILRPMMAFIKAWAKPLGLNKPSPIGGPTTFSSYALALMETLHRLVEYGDAAKLATGCSIDHWKPPTNLSLPEALYAWFRYWAIEYDYSAGLRVDIKRAFIPSSTSTKVRPNKGTKLVLIDPFIRNKIITKNISKKSLTRFRDECRMVTALLLPEGVSASEIGEKIDQLRRQHHTAAHDNRGEDDADEPVGDDEQLEEEDLFIEEDLEEPKEDSVGFGLLKAETESVDIFRSGGKAGPSQRSFYR